MKGILGRKVGMTEVFSTDGKLIPVTVISVEPNVVTQIKTVEKGRRCNPSLQGAWRE